METLAEEKMRMKKDLNIAQAILVIILTIFWIFICVCGVLYNGVKGASYSSFVMRTFPFFLVLAFGSFKWLNLMATTAEKNAEIEAKIQK